MNTTKRYKVLVIDDSLLVQQLLTSIINKSDYLEVVDVAKDPYEAREKIKQLNPDVVTLDVEMPRMDGITFLKNLMRLRPMPVVMISTLTEKGAEVTLSALELGAIDFIAKPKLNLENALTRLSREIQHKVLQAAKANVRLLKGLDNTRLNSKTTGRGDEAKTNNRFKLIAIGASTGGTEAIKSVLADLPTNLPPIVIVQHMPAEFTGCFAKRMNSVVDISVSEFNEQKAVLKPGHAYIANGARHMVVEKLGAIIQIHADDREPINRHKPSVDVLFDSVASNFGATSIGVILTGMGVDGAQGMLAMRERGAETMAQDQASSVVWGMPRVAIEREAAIFELSLTDIPKKIVRLCCDP